MGSPSGAQGRRCERGERGACAGAQDITAEDGRLAHETEGAAAR